jgi:hypothetical protein
MDYSLDIWNNNSTTRQYWQAEYELMDLLQAWHESDLEIPFTEFLGVTPKQYAAYVEGKITAKELLYGKA